jgi:hypothetical protein
MGKGVCAFCQREATLTGEHIWSDWMDRLVRAEHYKIGRLVKHFPKAEWITPNLNLKANVVCETCNNGWMSDLENEKAKPTILPMIRADGAFCFTKSGLDSLSVFAFKTALVADYMSTLKKRFFMPSVRHRFSRNLQIPPTVQVWLAWLRTTRIIGACNLSYDKVRGGRLNGLKLYTLTYAFGPIILQVVSFRHSNRLKATPGDKLVQDPNMIRTSPQIWPTPQAPVIWPPFKFIPYERLEKFSNRWKTLFPLRVT